MHTRQAPILRTTTAHPRRSALLAALVGGALLGATLTAVSVATANPGGPTAQLTLPYQAELLNAAGEPLKGTFDALVRVTAEPDLGSTLLWEEQFVSTVVDGGRLSLVLGTGSGTQGSLDAATLADHPSATVHLELDGEPVGSSGLVGTVPRALHAASVPATGVRFGGSDGLIPAEAVAPTVKTFVGEYKNGQKVPTEPGWNCSHLVAPLNVTPLLVGSAAELGDLDVWVGHVGPGLLRVRGSLWVTFPSSTPDDQLTIMHATNSCLSQYDPACNWEQSVDNNARARVQTICVAP